MPIQRKDDWAAVARAAYENPDMETAARLVERSAERLAGWLDQAGLQPWDVSVAWSGGKDSQGLRVVTDAVGIRSHYIIITAGLEFPEEQAWIAANRPERCLDVVRPFDLAWLAAHPQHCFQQLGGGGRWHQILQRDGHRQHLRLTGTGGQIIGRRYADGNSVGGGLDCYQTKEGVWRMCPIADWTHEELFCVLGAYRMAQAPAYQHWPRGFHTGTGNWAKRRVPDKLTGWREVAAIDRTVVEEAVRYFPAAAQAL